MRYRRFGRTELKMPVFSCGGMRYQHTWQDLPMEEIPADGQANLEATLHRALELGINHIETARGYGTSEMQLGRMLPSLPRENLIFQTKIGPNESAEKFSETFEKSMGYLQLGYVDLLAFHGINTDALLEDVLKPGGCMEVVRQLQREGRVRFVGFSTHGPCSVMVKAIETGEFDYINLHWYFVNDTNRPAIFAAHRHDMGVFIISPTDKGGRLQEPPARMVELCRPLSPMQFNDLYCLALPEVHTLSIGAARPGDFDEHVAALDYYDSIPQTLEPIQARLTEAMAQTLGQDWVDGWATGLPEAHTVPGEVNVQEILRLYTFAKSLDLTEWARGRYNLLGNGGHWAPGQTAANADTAALARVLAGSPFAERIPALLREAHILLGGDAVKRQSESS